MTKRIAVVGAGNLARVRTKALLATEKVMVCGVASRMLSSAQKFGNEIGCEKCFDDFKTLADTSPDAVLIEVPHGVQDDIVLWALGQGLHILIGGCLATSSIVAEKIIRAASSNRLVVEVGYQARYSALWEKAKRLITDGYLGQIVAVRSIALFAADPQSWYYQQHASGGMPLTHMTYVFINPIRGIFGDPLCVSAFANRIKQTGPGMVHEETCVANLIFDNDMVCSMTASFVKPGDVPGSSVLFLGTNGAMELFPSEKSLTIYRGAHAETQYCSSERDAFVVQAEVFLAALDGLDERRNKPDDTVGDIRVAEAIVASSEQRDTVWM